MLIIPVLIAAAGFAATLFCKARHTSHCALFTVFGLAVLVPSHSPPRDVLTAAAIGAITVLAVAIARVHRSVLSGVPNLWLIGFILYSSGMQLFAAEGLYAWFLFLSAVVYVLLSFLVSQQQMNGSYALLFALPIVILIQLSIATAEEFLGMKALWPLTNGTDVITHRVNPIAPWLPGRAMGSTSHPIPLGMLMGASLVLCIWVAMKVRRRFAWLFVMLAAVAILFSGTRNAVLAVLLAVAYWFSSQAGSKRLPIYVLGGAFGAIFVLSVDPDSLPGMAGFYSSESYIHRLHVLEFLPELFNRPILEVIFGSGYDSIAALLQSSTFSGGTGIQVFDQEYVRTFAAIGLLGLLLLMMAIVEGFRRGNVPSRLMLVFLCVNFASFDALNWNLLMTLFVMAASGPLMDNTSRLAQFQCASPYLPVRSRGLADADRALLRDSSHRSF